MTAPLVRADVVATSNVSIATGLSAGNTIDGQTLVGGWIVLLTAQTDPSENGLYDVPLAGRAPRLAGYRTEYNSLVGISIYVMRGASNADTKWDVTSDPGGTLGVTALTIINSNDATATALAGKVDVAASLPGIFLAQKGATEASDITALLQEAITTDAVATPGEIFINLRSGTLSDTVLVGPSSGLRGVLLSALGAPYTMAAQHPGSRFPFTAKDRPAFIVRGGRRSRLKGFRVEGVATDLGTMDITGKSPTLESSWDDVLDAASVTRGRYTPYAAIAPGALNGSAPSPAYSLPYGSAPSSSTQMIDIGVKGFEVAVCINPSALDANEDFSVLRDALIEDCKYAVSVCPTQSRQVEIDNLQCSRVHILFVNDKHGLQAGHFGGTIKHVSIYGYATAIFEFSAGSVVGPTTLESLHAEGLHVIGGLTGTGGTPYAIRLLNPTINFRHNNTNGVPQRVLYGADFAQVELEAGRIQVTGAAASLLQNTLFRGTSVVNQHNPDKPYRALAHNCISGGLITDPILERSQEILFTPYSAASTPVAQQRQTTNENFTATGRDTCIPHTLYRGKHSFTTIVSPPWRKPFYAATLGAGSRSSVSRTNRAVTFTNAALTSEERAYRLGMHNGCIDYDRATGVALAIRSTDFGTKVQIAELLDNYIDDGAGGFDLFDTWDPTAGTWWTLNSLIYVPERALYGRFVKGVAAIVDVRSAGGVDSALFGLTAGDRYAGWLDPTIPITMDNTSAGLVIGTPVLPAAINISGVTQANPGVVTSTAHGLYTGERGVFASVGGMTELNGNTYKAIVLDANTFSLRDEYDDVVDTTGFTAYTSGGTFTPTGGRIPLGAGANYTSGALQPITFFCRQAPANEASR